LLFELRVGFRRSEPFKLGGVSKVLSDQLHGAQLMSGTSALATEGAASQFRKRGHSSFQKGPVGMERGQYPGPGAVLIRTLATGT
jgi:hypothetical protein